MNQPRQSGWYMVTMNSNLACLPRSERSKDNREKKSGSEGGRQEEGSEERI